ncbi:non-histone chromosomal protein HMG-17 [Platysternon megacephalum]|uniref:Non-histone chromosomal protein HMG-17 n=1 Tax=Platysternon megacephalum TaxID=55544 RepID=A0A4D9EZ03_9SAUR|nr:non-histone chromosomal protein HMG-17 [Platysternon megacephalum]
MVGQNSQSPFKRKETMPQLGKIHMGLGNHSGNIPIVTLGTVCLLQRRQGTGHVMREITWILGYEQRMGTITCNPFVNALLPIPPSPQWERGCFWNYAIVVLPKLCPSTSSPDSGVFRV